MSGRKPGETGGMQEGTMETMKRNCPGMESKLADLLLDPIAFDAQPESARVREHVAECGHCRQELAELNATMAAMDAWEAPEPSPFFMTRMNARLNEERAAAPAGWFERLRARFVYGGPAHVRPLAAMALTVMLLVGGGTYLSVSEMDNSTQATPQAAVVHDLQTLDSNAQLLDQLEALSTNNDGNY